MLLSQVIDHAGTDVALQICDDNDWCNNAKLQTPNPTKTRLGFCSWCWSSLNVEVK
jgi:hypothetical protein